MVSRATEYTYDFRNFKTTRTFGKDIYEGKITLEEVNNEQSNLVHDIRNLNSKTRPQNDKKKKKEKLFLKTCLIFFEGREKVLNAVASKIFIIKSKGSGILNTNQSKLKILMPKQMLQRFPIALAQVTAGNNSESLLNEIRQIVFSLYQSKESTKKVYHNIIKSILTMDTIFMNSENSKTSK